MRIIWKEPWLLPIDEMTLEVTICNYCNNKFRDLEFVTSCEFCEIGTIHTECSEKHIIEKHRKELEKKIESYKEKKLHDFQ